MRPRYPNRTHKVLPCFIDIRFYIHFIIIIIIIIIIILFCVERIVQVQTMYVPVHFICQI